VIYAYTNNNCLLCTSDVIVSVAIPTITNCDVLNGAATNLVVDRIRMTDKNVAFDVSIFIGFELLIQNLSNYQFN